MFLHCSFSVRNVWTKVRTICLRIGCSARWAGILLVGIHQENYVETVTNDKTDERKVGIIVNDTFGVCDFENQCNVRVGRMFRGVGR